MSADDLALIAASEKDALEAAAKACFLDHRRRVRVARIEEFVRDYSEKSGDEQSLRVFQELPEGKKNRLDFISSREFDPVLTAEALKGWHAENYPDEVVGAPQEAGDGNDEKKRPDPGSDLDDQAEFQGLAEKDSEVLRAQGISRQDLRELTEAEWREVFPRVGDRVRVRRWAKGNGRLCLGGAPVPPPPYC